MKAPIFINKVLLFATITSIGFTACKTETKKNKPIKIDNSNKFDDKEQIEKAFTEFKKLYGELNNFKNNEDFKKIEFKKSKKYTDWLKKIQEFRKTSDSRLLIKKGVFIGELEQLGRSYASSKGLETKVTKAFDKVFDDAISKSSIINEKSTSSANINYDQLKNNYELFGKWTIKNTSIKENYDYEIYKNGNKFIGVRLDNFKTEDLNKKGSDFYVIGNKFEEFYRIDEDLNMILFDRDGNLSSTGYKAVKVK